MQNDERSEWITMTYDQAVEHLKTWIEGIDDSHDIARLMMAVCGVAKTAVDERSKTISVKLG
jgi:hypothetical protein